MYRKHLLGEADEEILKYISSLEEDKVIVREVVEVLKAHVEGLMKEKVVPKEAALKIIEVLNSLLKDPTPLFNVEAEDVHEAIEVYLKSIIGDDAGWLALGRSRNDHVASALRIKVRRYLLKLLNEILKLRRKILNVASKNLNTIMPLHTHLQPAQVSTFAHYILGVEEILTTYTKLIIAAIEDVVNYSPLGSAAIASSTVPIDRQYVASKLGFKGVVVNSLYATSSRDFLTIAASIVTCLSVSLSRIAEDLIIYVTPQYNYLEVNPKHMSTSSIMPHKRNLVTMEIARAWAGEAIGHLVSILSIIKGIPSGYNLDLQEANKHVVRVFEKTIDTVRVLGDLISNVKPNVKRLTEDSKKYPLTVTELAEYLSLKLNIPYRKVHERLAKVIRESKRKKDLVNNVAKEFNIKTEEVLKVLNTRRTLSRKVAIGSPNPKVLAENLRFYQEALRDDERCYVEILKRCGDEKSINT